MILTNDPSITAWGWVIIAADGEIIESGCIKTEPSPKKLRIRKGDDRLRRITEINQKLYTLIRKHSVKLILSESPHGSQNAQAAMMVGMVAGVLQTFSDLLQIPIEWYSEAECKKALLGKRSATKQEIIERINTEYEIIFTDIKYKDEAVADAMAVYHLAKSQSNMIKMLKK